MSDFIAKLETLNVWKRGGLRAPNKPLLLLLALGRYQSEGQTDFRFKEIEADLESLLREFGPTRKTYHASYPFWRLQNDGIWTVTASDALRQRKSNTDPTLRSLRQSGATGSFSSSVVSEFERDPNCVARAAKLLLERSFPRTLHEDIANAVGLALDEGRETVQRRRRDPKFRRSVLRAYDYSCAMCGMDIRLDNLTLGIEAAHIKWHQAGGPDEVCNGLALCPTHHKFFDAGAMTLNSESEIVVSEAVHGTTGFIEQLDSLAGKRIHQPKDNEAHPNPAYLHWHNQEVFRDTGDSIGA